MRLKKAAVVLPPTRIIGPVGFWILEALKKHYCVYVIKIGKLNWKENEWWGTNVKPFELNIIQPKAFLLNNTYKFTQLRFSVLARFVKKYASYFDVVLSTYNIMDFGIKGIQFIGDFIFLEEFKNYIYLYPEKRESGWFYKKSIIRDVYLKLTKKIYNPSYERVWRNQTIANSRWTSNIIKQKYGIDSKIIYPPIMDNECSVDWEKREDGFICLSKIVPFKQIERAIEIVSGLNKTGLEFHLHIIGPDNDSVYSHKIKTYCLRHKKWCFFEGPVFGKEKQKIMAQHKFGLNCCQNEAFGMAVGEMVKSGMLVWVPNGGGQMEIVGHPMLVYDDTHDAIKKIMKVLRDVSIRNNLRKHLAVHSAQFSTEKFKKEVRNTVRVFIDRKLD